jgi:hypothetical protein
VGDDDADLDAPGVGAVDTRDALALVLGDGGLTLGVWLVPHPARSINETDPAAKARRIVRFVPIAVIPDTRVRAGTRGPGLTAPEAQRPQPTSRPPM